MKNKPRLLVICTFFVILFFVCIYVYRLTYKRIMNKPFPNPSPGQSVSEEEIKKEEVQSFRQHLLNQKTNIETQLSRVDADLSEMEKSKNIIVE